MIRKIVCAAGIALAIAACGTREPERTTGGAAAGAATGAGIGALGGPVGALAGAAIGAGAGAVTGATTSPSDLNLGRPLWSDPEVRTPLDDDRRRGRAGRRARDRDAQTAQNRRRGEPRDERDRAYMGGGMVDTRSGTNTAPSTAGGNAAFEAQPPVGSTSPSPTPVR
jgi:hypothetical protein